MAPTASSYSKLSSQPNGVACPPAGTAAEGAVVQAEFQSARVRGPVGVNTVIRNWGTLDADRCVGACPTAVLHHDRC